MSSSSVEASVTKRVVVARHLFHLASEQARTNRCMAAFAAIILLQDAVETFLLAAAEHLSLEIREQISFVGLFDAVEAGSPGSKGFRMGLIRANRTRVQGKHHAVQPDRSEVDESIALTGRFLSEASERIFGRSFWSMSLLDEIDNHEVKVLLDQAEVSFGAGDYAKTLIHSRCAFYLVFERLYDVRRILRNEEGDTPWKLLDFIPLNLPADYHDQVSEPFDYIFLDHVSIERDLIADGIDQTVFWNIITLTPAVYSYRSQWLVRADSKLLDVDNLPYRASYALEHTAEVILRRQARLKAAKSGPLGEVGGLRVRDPEAPIYRKATKQSEVLGLARVLNEPIEADALVPSLEGDWFWKVLYTPSKAVSQSMPGVQFYVYVRSAALEPATDEAKQAVSRLRLLNDATS